MKRYNRFGDVGIENSGMILGKIAKKSTSFFLGNDITKRMNEMRAAILYVRKNWDNKKLKENAVKEFEKDFCIKLTDKNWCDTPEFKKECSDYELIEFYTSDRGYDSFFGRMNGRIRSIDSSNIEKDLGSYREITETAFLIEYMNIELYNFIHERKDFANFEGCVYRGMKVPKEVIEDFSHIKEYNVDERKISVPLSFMSASKNEEVAIKFLESNSSKKKLSDEQENLIMEIHVGSLSQEYLDFYHRLFPNSVVSSLCAVPIKELSSYKNEDEVLLRGAFFQALDFYKDPKLEIAGKPVYKIKLFMMNSNRDHITTSQFENTNARNIFNALVSIDKLRLSRRLLVDERQQELYFDEERSKLIELEKMKNKNKA